MRHFHFGDSLDILLDRIRYDSVDLIYYTPPFYSKRDYNLLFRTAKGHHSDRTYGYVRRMSGWPLNAVPRLQDK